MVGSGTSHCFIIRTEVADMSIEWLERGILGLFSGRLSCGMSDVVAARSGGHEVRAWACTGIGCCSRNFGLKICLYCFLCISNVACRLAHG